MTDAHGVWVQDLSTVTLSVDGPLEEADMRPACFLDTSGT